MPEASPPLPPPHPSGANHTPADRTADRRSDEDLVDAIRSGEAGAWNELARRTLPRVFGLCYRLLGQGTGGRDAASDAAQATMLRLVQVIGRYDARSRFSTWVYRVTTNICISRMRAAKVRKASSLDAPGSRLADPAHEAPSIAATLPQHRELVPDSGVQHSERTRLLREALEHLEPDQRMILILRDGQDLSYEHIAQVLGISIGTVKSRIFRARSAVRDHLEAGLSEPALPTRSATPDVD